MDIKISVIIPTYNRAHCVTNAIDSVLSQTYQDYEILVVDDGSTDRTREVLDSYIRDQKIVYLYQDNRGVSAARNAGIRKASGQWIACLDSDDRWMPDKLKRQVSVITESAIEVGCVVCNIQYDRPIGKRTSSFENAIFNPRHSRGICHNIRSILLTRFLMFNQCALIKKQYVDEIGGFDERLEILEDYDLALKLSFLCRWGYDSEPLVLYHCPSGQSLSSGVSPEREIQTMELILFHLDSFLRDRAIRVPRLLAKRRRFLRIQKKLHPLSSGRKLLRIYQGLIRRMPGYPRPHVVPLDAAPMDEVNG